MAYVLKASGEKQEFSQDKLRFSIKRAGIPDELQDRVVEHVQLKLYDGIKTSEIYRHVLEFLKTSSHPHSSAKYGLKQAIMDFGPTGFPFEDFVSEIFKAQGYQTETRSILAGKCISHEVDIVAQKDGRKFMVECKFHNSSGIKSDVHVSLYTKARFDDLKEKNNFNQAFLVTNTKVTTDALAYALCNNLQIIAWDYPENGSLRVLVEKLNLHPITTLTLLSQNQKQILLEHHLVLCKDICQSPESLAILNLPSEKVAEILVQAKSVCSS